MKDNKKAFTLIELLVVVLIIGILAAVALPQYQLAVEKSRVAQVVSSLRSIQQAEEVYYLANNEYTNNLEDLDIDVASPEGWTLLLMDSGNRKVEFVREEEDLKIFIYFHNQTASKHFYLAGKLSCWAAKRSSLATRICQNISGSSEKTDTTNGSRWFF